jgi:hypothetical protein
MKKFTIAVVVAFFAISLAFATLAVAGPQQEKMKPCNKGANEKNLNGEERQKFMKECLGAKPAALVPQETRMKVCNEEVTERNLTGEARKKFMIDCLSPR